MWSEARRRHGPSDEWLRALLGTAGVWTLLLLAPRLARAAGAGEHALLAAYAGATGLVCGSAPRDERPPARGALALGFASGALCFTGWAALVAALGTALGLAPPRLPLGSGIELESAVASALLGPVWEERLYRGWLLPALAVRTGWPAAIALSSAAFALPHGEPWSVLTTFGLGLTLGLSRRLGARTRSCVGAHAGLDVAFWLRDALDLAAAPAWLPCLGAALWALRVRLDRAGPPRHPPVPAPAAGC